MFARVSPSISQEPVRAWDEPGLQAASLQVQVQHPASLHGRKLEQWRWQQLRLWTEWRWWRLRIQRGIQSWIQLRIQPGIQSGIELSGVQLSDMSADREEVTVEVVAS